MTGYTANGTFIQNGVVVGNPHQQLHDLVNPTLWTTAEDSFTNSTDPSFVQGTLSEIESAIAVAPEPGGLALSRLYICQRRSKFPHFGRSKFPHLLWCG
ncbi:MAG: hypothetical protein JNK17_14170 [Hydrogenophaga sp.]|nr:hypothetical protein [Hydrogenophaga sp.]